MNGVKHHKALSSRFTTLFGIHPRIFRAPGRVNLIGEHTDYNGGFVMPAAIDLSCWVAAAPRDDRTVSVHSVNMSEHVDIDIDAHVVRTGTWRDYVAGVVLMLHEQGALQGGATLLVDSEVPVGAGLSSSAALEVGVATALLDLAGVSLDGRALARLCQRAENEVVGASCGIMDQYVACHARAGTALMLDCRSLEHQHLPLPAGLSLVICNSMVRHSIATGEYNRRREECTAAVAVLAAEDGAVGCLRDVDVDQLNESRELLPGVLFRRARHVVTENARVLEAAAALRGSDLGTLGSLMAESHRSMRDDFEISCAELDILVDIARDLPGLCGARMTGGGFGGCTVNLVQEDAVARFRLGIAETYFQRTGLQPDIHVVTSADAAGRADR